MDRTPSRIPKEVNMGLLKDNYGPNSTRADEQMNALQKRGFNLAAKAKAMSNPPIVPGITPPPQASAVPVAMNLLKGARK